MKLHKIIMVIGLLLMLSVNFLANALPIAGFTTGELSDFYPNLFTPAGFTFSIWGLLYLGLIFVVLNYLFTKKPEPEFVVLFFINGILNSSWILFWHYQHIAISVLIMVLLFGNLFQLNKHLIQNRNHFNSFLYFPVFQVYFGWINFALIANITAFLVSIKWNGWGIDESIWTQILLGTGFIICYFLSRYFNSIFFILVAFWTYFGVYVKHTSPNAFEGQYPTIINTLYGMFVLLGILFVHRIYRMYQKQLT